MEIKIYLAGPITGIKNENIEQFRMVQDLLIKKGYKNIIVPHDIFNDEEKNTFTHQQFMDRCLPELERCDIAVFLAYWQKSKGAIMEHKHAKDNNVRIRYAYLDIPEYKQFILDNFTNETA